MKPKTSVLPVLWEVFSPAVVKRRCVGLCVTSACAVHVVSHRSLACILKCGVTL